MGKVGVIGLGIMGRPMAQNLLKAGYEVMVRDLNPTPVEALVRQGAVAGSNREIGAGCDVILLVLPNGRIVQNVLFGRDGLAEFLSPGTLVCDMSSVTPGESQTCCERLDRKSVV